MFPRGMDEMMDDERGNIITQPPLYTPNGNSYAQHDVPGQMNAVSGDLQASGRKNVEAIKRHRAPTSSARVSLHEVMDPYQFYKGPDRPYLPGPIRPLGDPLASPPGTKSVYLPIVDFQGRPVERV